MSKERMTPEEYRMLIADRGMTQNGAARFFGVSELTGRRWCALGGEGPTPTAAKFLRYMVAKNLKPAQVDKALAASFLFGEADKAKGK